MHRSVHIIGWSTIFISVIIILSEFISLMSNPMEQLNVLFNTFPQTRAELESMTDLFTYGRIWSAYTIVYFLVVLIGASKFVRFHVIGRLILEVACWIGIVNACIDSLLSYMILQNLKTALSAAKGLMGMSLGILNPLGTATIIFGFFLWVIPSIGMIVYLRNPNLKVLMK